jgi:urease accessory protein
MMKKDKVEKIQVSRLEADRIRIRKVSDKGTDLALTLNPGSHIYDGDVILLAEERMVVAKRESENVATVILNNDVSTQQILDTTIKLGQLLETCTGLLALQTTRYIFQYNLILKLNCSKSYFKI